MTGASASNELKAQYVDNLERRKRCPHDGCYGRIDGESRVCDTCYCAPDGTLELPTVEDTDENENGSDGGDGVHVVVPRREDYRRDRYDSGHVRLFGGYTQAYVAERTGDKEYSIDTYDDVTEGLWTPHNRSVA